jgi:hypothetical protein
MKKVIYTSLVGNHDVLRNPIERRSGWDYICFSNDHIDNSENLVWQIKSIPIQDNNNIRLSRYVKILPHRILQSYDYSLWIDANIQLIDNSFFDKIDSLINDQVIISLIPHYLRSCIYSEADACIELGKDSIIKINALKKVLKNDCYPENNGLFENGIILRFHNSPKIVELNEEWWRIYISYSKRDQLSLTYLLWKHNIPCIDMFPRGNSVRNLQFLKFYPHNFSMYEKLKFKFRGLVNLLIKQIIL